VTKRGKRISLIVVGAVASLVLFAVWLFYATVNETPPYAFMRGAKQVGYVTVPSIELHPVRREGTMVVRFFILDVRYEDLLSKAKHEHGGLVASRNESLRKFKLGPEPGDDITLVLTQPRHIEFTPLQSDRSKTIAREWGSAEGLEAIVGRVFRSVPGQYADQYAK
jgi:hypothetical protein